VGVCCTSRGRVHNAIEIVSTLQIRSACVHAPQTISVH
jgi:hypothetical protein